MPGRQENPFRTLSHSPRARSAAPRTINRLPTRELLGADPHEPEPLHRPRSAAPERSCARLAASSYRRQGTGDLVARRANGSTQAPEETRGPFAFRPSPARSSAPGAQGLRRRMQILVEPWTHQSPLRPQQPPHRAGRAAQSAGRRPHRPPRHAAADHQLATRAGGAAELLPVRRRGDDHRQPADDRRQEVHRPPARHPRHRRRRRRHRLHARPVLLATVGEVSEHGSCWRNQTSSTSCA